MGLDSAFAAYGYERLEVLNVAALTHKKTASCNKYTRRLYNLNNIII